MKVILLLVCLALCSILLEVHCNEEMNAMTALLNATTSMSMTGEEGIRIVDTSDPLTVAQASLSSSEDVLKDIDTSKQVDEQTRVDTLARALQRIPDSELARYKVSAEALRALAQPQQIVIGGDKKSSSSSGIAPGSKVALELQRAWTQRQADLKRAIDSMAKISDIIKAQLDIITSNTNADTKSKDTESEGEERDARRESALLALADLCDDVDNARDFHTAGGVQALAPLLNPEIGEEENLRGLVALVLGTAVKNNYDFQLWLLEDEHGNDGNSGINGNSGIEGNSGYKNKDTLVWLIQLLKAKDERVQRRALYALSSAARGNADIQEVILDITVPTASTTSTSTTETLTQEPELESQKIKKNATDEKTVLLLLEQSLLPILQANGPGSSLPSAELVRKAVAFSVDMLEEYSYIQQQIANPSGISVPLADGAEGLTSQAALEAVSMQLMQQLHALRPLGAQICTETWSGAIYGVFTETVAVLTRDGEEDTDSGNKTTEVEIEVEVEGKQSLLSGLKQKIGLGSNKGNKASVLDVSTVVPTSTLRAIAESSLGSLQYMQQHCPAASVSVSSVSTSLSELLQLLEAWCDRAGDRAGELRESVSAFRGSVLS